MTTEAIIIPIFCLVDEQWKDSQRVPQTHLDASEIGRAGILFALKGGQFGGYYRWLKRDFAALFAGLPE